MSKYKQTPGHKQNRLKKLKGLFEKQNLFYFSLTQRGANFLKKGGGD